MTNAARFPRLLRRVHVVCTVAVCAQLAIWTVTGLGFTLADFDEVRGARERAPAGVLPVGPARVTLEEALTGARELAPGAVIEEVRVRAVAGRAMYVVSLAGGGDPILVGADDGRARRGLDDQEALAIARAAHVGDVAVASLDRVTREGDAPDLELPVVRACFADGKGTCVFVSPRSGEVVAFRNDAWRSFDRLYSLHVLGYVSRSTPAHAPLRILAALAVLAVASGLALVGTKVFLRLRLRRRQRSRAPTEVVALSHPPRPTSPSP